MKANEMKIKLQALTLALYGGELSVSLFDRQAALVEEPSFAL
jgi:hypothetical protein